MEDERTDGRRLGSDGQHQLRKSAARLLSKGLRPSEVAGLLGVSRQFVYNVKARAESGGAAALRPKARGRKAGSKRRLTPEQESFVVETITEKNPDQLKMACCLWDRRSVAELAMREFGVGLPPSTVGCYLRRWGFSKQRPVRRANRQDPERIRAWLEEEYPEIEQKARSEGAEIYWGDETALQNTSNFIKGYSPRGRAPVLMVEARRMKLNMLSAVSNRGKLRFTITRETVGPDTLIGFMRRLCRDSGRKVLLILDNLRAHHSKKVAAWAAVHGASIEVFFLPAYAPEYNPDEYLDSDLKREMERLPSASTEEELSGSARSFLARRQRQPDKVESYFKNEHTRYAAGL
ncbi:MAG: IS630 family transposase [Coriobacteriales bacterium]|jgi:transposase|nr:IS630 family transposase [Coriobacteriales bacterium]